MGQRYTLADKPVLVGRSQDSDIRVPDNGVSRTHTRIELTADGVYVTDLASTNGTFINDRQIKGTEMIRDGDYLRVGNTIYRFLAGGNVESEYHEEIYRLTIMDALTHVHNRRYLLEFLERELVRSVRHSRPLAFLLFDVDRFKVINERFGPLAGDSALRELASLVRTMVGSDDLLARYGGEEFGIVLVETNRKSALAFAERVRETIERHTFKFDKQSFHLTVSAGFVGVPDDAVSTTKDIIQLADKRLRDAKQAGRNRIVDTDDESSTEENSAEEQTLARAI
jgi:diguanylate cyclase (GGDEF)-like protein